MLFPIDIRRTLLYIAQSTAHTIVSPRPHDDHYHLDR